MTRASCSLLASDAFSFRRAAGGYTAYPLGAPDALALLRRTRGGWWIAEAREGRVMVADRTREKATWRCVRELAGMETA